jgi:hypothetical protein
MSNRQTYTVILDHKEKLRRVNMLHFFINAPPGQLDFCTGQRNRLPMSLQYLKNSKSKNLFSSPSFTILFFQLLLVNQQQQLFIFTAFSYARSI